MAEILCCSCSSTTCDGLLTVGYMESLIPNGHCATVIEPAPFTSGCCSAESSATVVSRLDMLEETYGYLRGMSDTDPNNDTSGFFVDGYDGEDDYSGCCSDHIDGDLKILKRSDIAFGYTQVVLNTLDTVVEPTVCDLNYTVRETKTYIRHYVECDGESTADTPSSVTVTVKHSNDDSSDSDYTEVKDEGVFEKTFTKTETSNGVTWDVSFSPNSKEITGLTSNDCGDILSSTTTFSFNDYTLGYEIQCPTEEIKCPGGVISMTYTANTNCENDLIIEVTANYDAQVGDPTFIEELSDGIEVYRIDITIPMNTENHQDGTITISYSAGTDTTSTTSPTDTGYTECIYPRELCAWNAKNVSNPDGCSAFWPEIGWESIDTSIDIENRDVIEVQYDEQ